MNAYIGGFAAMTAATVLCNLVVLTFRHPRLPRLISGEFVAMIVAVLLTIMMVGAYAAAVGQIASSLPARYTTSVLVGAAAFNFGLAFVVSAVMGMPRRLRQAREGGSPFARHRPVTLGATPARA